MKKNQKGFSAVEGLLILIVEGLLILIIVGIVGSVGWYVYHSRNNALASYDKASAVSNIKLSLNKRTRLNSTDIAKLQALSASPAASPVFKAPTPVAKPTTKTMPTPSPAPPPPAPQGAISFSSDGCYVTGSAVPGMTFEVGAFTPTKGGSTTYILPASGSLTKSSGGQLKNMTSYGLITDSAGNRVAYSTSSLTNGNCPPSD